MSLRGLRSKLWKSIPLLRHRRSFVLLVAFIVFLSSQTGCETPASISQPSPKPRIDSNDISIYSYYTPTKVQILPLTELTQSSGSDDLPSLRAYVSLLDKFSCQIKSPAIFRLELYEYVSHSAKPKGKRLVIWPDIDLTEPEKNNQYWRDFLRAYEFDMPFDLKSDKGYVIQATCLCPDGKRLSADLELKHTK